MNHQPFKSWITLNEELSREQKRELADHLQRCPDCRQIQRAQGEINQLFKTTPIPEPAPGFSDRWMQRINQREKRENALFFRLTFGLSVVTLLALAAGVGFQVRSQLPSFSPPLPVAAAQTARWIFFLNHLGDFFRPILNVSFQLIPRSWLFTTWLGLTTVVTVPTYYLLKILFSNQEVSP